jgi:TRAP-type uncharacterized transport system fused permease subunit
MKERFHGVGEILECTCMTEKKSMENKIAEIKKKMKNLQISYYLTLILNVILLSLSYCHFYYNDNKLVIDLYFIIILLFNLISFYLTYKIANELHFTKYQFEHFSNLK